MKRINQSIYDGYYLIVFKIFVVVDIQKLHATLMLFMSPNVTYESKRKEALIVKCLAGSWISVDGKFGTQGAKFSKN